MVHGHRCHLRLLQGKVTHPLSLILWDAVPELLDVLITAQLGNTYFVTKPFKDDTDLLFTVENLRRVRRLIARTAFSGGNLPGSGLMTDLLGCQSTPKPHITKALNRYEMF